MCVSVCVYVCVCVHLYLFLLDFFFFFSLSGSLSDGPLASSEADSSAEDVRLDLLRTFFLELLESFPFSRLSFSLFTLFFRFFGGSSSSSSAELEARSLSASSELS